MATLPTWPAVRQVAIVGALLRVPAQFFAIPMGLAGLGGTWRLATTLVNVPAAVANLIYLLAAAVLLLLSGALVARLAIRPQRVINELAHPAHAPFYALLPISGMLLALGLMPYARDLGAVLFLTCFAATWLFGGWLTSRWIVDTLNPASIHPGFFLPTIAGGMVAAEGAASIGAFSLAWISFGMGLVCWMMLGPIIMNRLLTRSPLPTALTPSLAITLAPPFIAGNAYFALNGGKADGPAHILAGYGVLMVLVQIGFLPLYRATRFAPSYWSFTFPCAAAASCALHWIALLEPFDGTALAWTMLLLLTSLIGSIALRSLVAIWRGTFLPRAE